MSLDNKLREIFKKSLNNATDFPEKSKKGLKNFIIGKTFTLYIDECVHRCSELSHKSVQEQCFDILGFLYTCLLNAFFGEKRLEVERLLCKLSKATTKRSKLLKWTGEVYTFLHTRV